MPAPARKSATTKQAMPKASKKHPSPFADLMPPHGPRPPIIASGAADDDPFGRVRVYTFVDGKLNMASIPLEQVLALEAVGFDCNLNFVQGSFCVLNSTGERWRHVGALPRIGSKRIQLLIALMLHPGLMLRPYQLAKLAGINSEYPEVPLAASIAALRKYLLREKGSEWYIRTGNPLSYGWSPSRSFLLQFWESDLDVMINGNGGDLTA
ncbi:MAG: hypothetical protein D8M59_03705 [Planctomycetes bacterium]|nr:hypothetical protein [Planctomycetota bacterium]NOG53102.1 hypothetical protein [Planctomycetota bacterium]